MAYHSAVWGWLVWRLAPPHFYCPFYRTHFDKILLTILNISSILVLEHLFDCDVCERGAERWRIMKTML